MYIIKNKNNAFHLTKLLHYKAIKQSSAHTTMNKEKLPLVTIAVSSYNHEKYIQQCLSSLLQQTYPNIELIVFDDGSTDNTPNIIESIREERSFYFEKRKNHGLTRTLNDILKIAKGKYFTVLGSDDIAMLDKIEHQVDLMESDESIGICGGNVLLIDQAGTITPKQKMHSSHHLNFEDIILNKKAGAAAPTLFFRTDDLRDVGGYNEKVALEDLYIILKVSEKKQNMLFSNRVLAYYRVHPTNTYKNLDFMSKGIFETLDHFKDSPYYPAAQQNAFVSLFIKASKRNKPLAKKLLKGIKLKNYSFRVIKGLARLLLP